MTVEYPRYVFKGAEPETKIVEDDDELSLAKTEGWAFTREEALAVLKEPVVELVPADDSSVTRAELEAKAEELKIKFHPSISDKNLEAKIDAALLV